MILSECRQQACSEFDQRAWAGCEPNIHKASFTERRLFYLKIKLLGLSLSWSSNSSSPDLDAKSEDFAVRLCYKGM